MERANEKKPTGKGGLGRIWRQALKALVFSEWVWAATAWLAAPHERIRGARMRVISSAGER